MKRALIILGVLLIMAAVLGLGYYLSTREEVPAPGGEEGLSADNPQGKVPELTNSGANPGAKPADAVNPDPGLAFFVDNSGNIISVQKDGRIAQYRGTLKEFLSTGTLTRPFKAAFSFDGSRILVGWNTPAEWSVFSLKDKSWTPLPGNISEAAWSGTEDNLTYLVKTGGNTLLVEDPVNPKVKPKTLARLDMEDVSLRRVNKDLVLIEEFPSAEYKGGIWSYRPSTGVMAKIAEHEGASATWHVSGDKGLLFKSGGGGKGGSLSLVGAKGETIEALNILTLPKKCLFRDEPVSGSANTSTSKTASSAIRAYLICAVPKDQAAFQASKLPDAYEKESLFTEDEFIRIDLKTGGIATLFSKGAALDAEGLFVRNNLLYFKNRYDDKLYSVSLNP